MREKLVEAKGLYKQYALKSDKIFAKRRYLKAVDGVTFDIYKGVTFGITETIHMGVKAMGTRQRVDTMGDLFLDITVAVVAIDSLEEQGRNHLAVQIHQGDVFRVDDDVYIMVVNGSDSRVMEGGESDGIDALLDWGNPHHGWVAEMGIRSTEVLRKEPCGLHRMHR